MHPESPERIEAVLSRIQHSAIADRLVWQESNEADFKWIETIHDRAYIRYVEESTLIQREMLDQGDTFISPGSFRAARLGVGGAIQAVDSVMQGTVSNAFLATRPPGHHACKANAMGFCIFNNIAIAARYAQKQYGLERILILDWDIHHGNGTQDAFYNDPTVLFASLHQFPYYPGTGSEREQGEGKGMDYTINCPMLAGADWGDYELAFSKIILPRVAAFNPNLILISAGFDAHKEDPLAQVQLESNDFYKMTQLTKALADQCCSGRLVSLLEGGYNIGALTESVEAHVTALLEPS